MTARAAANKPVLVVMAAGMGSRYGGLKQIDPVDAAGDIIMDFSLFDAKAAGFEDVVFIIKREHEADFRAVLDERLAGQLRVTYCYQELTDLPAGFAVPAGRVKPWGTAHAVLSCREVIDGPFAVINADDYYGREAFALIYDYLQAHQDDTRYRYAMVGYQLRNTVTEHGYVSRGICRLDAAGRLAEVTERTRIEKHGTEIAYTEDEGRTYHTLAPETPVSMNMWGFSASMMKEIEQRFAAFLEKGLAENPLKCEYFLPAVASELLAEDKATVQVLHSPDKWYGVTYKEDKAVVTAAMEAMKAAGQYPAELWK